MQLIELQLNEKEFRRFERVCRKRIEKRGLTFVKVAEDIGVSKKSLYNFFGDHRHSKSKYIAAKLANYLELKPEDWYVRPEMLKTKADKRNVSTANPRYVKKKPKKKTVMRRDILGRWYKVTLLLASALILWGTNARAKEDTDHVKREYPKYEQSKEEIYNEVFGIEYNNDFTPGYYDAYVIEDIDISPDEQIKIKNICESKGLKFGLVMALIEVESGYDREAVNSSNTCFGACQLNTTYHDVENPYDLLSNVDIATTYLKSLIDEGNGIYWALDKYHGDSCADSNLRNNVESYYASYIIERGKQIEQELDTEVY